MKIIELKGVDVMADVRIGNHLCTIVGNTMVDSDGAEYKSSNNLNYKGDIVLLAARDGNKYAMNLDEAKSSYAKSGENFLSIGSDRRGVRTYNEIMSRAKKNVYLCRL